MAPEKAVLANSAKRYSGRSFEDDLTVTLKNLYINFSDRNATLAGDCAWDLRELLTHSRSQWQIDRVLEDLVESQREAAILDVLTGAKTLAEKSHPGYHNYLHRAFEIADLELGEDYTPHPGRYLWVEDAANKIILAYVSNQKMV